MPVLRGQVFKSVRPLQEMFLMRTKTIPELRLKIKQLLKERATLRREIKALSKRYEKVE